ncbi:DNA internalization-related competence protein ComEC/Rec2 [bacterium]|nr:DNA internalization-related competence protein ComEC/Rec2 [bacterium]
MLKQILNYAAQNKNLLMFVTALLYILGISAYFSNTGIVLSIIVSLLGIISICKNFFPPKLILFWIFIFYLGFVNCIFRIKNTDELYQIAPQKCSIEGQIVSIPNSNFSDKAKFFFETDKGKTLVTINSKDEDFSNLKIGSYYKINGKLRIPFEAVNPSQFDYGKYLKNFGVFTVFYADKTNVTLIPKNLEFKWKFIQHLNNLRIKIIDTHKQYLKSPYLEILGGIVFGDDAVAPPDYIKTTFINSGLLHILAASGMNVAFIYGFWFFILNKCLKCPFKITVLTGMLVIVLYSLMTGLGASVIRATIMILFILAGKLIDRDTHSIALLSLVAMLMLIYNPAFINDVGFQLSFLVTFGLLISSNLLTKDSNKFIMFCKDTILIPIIAQIWVAPLQMFYFNTFCVYSVFANIVSVIFLPFISFGGFISSIMALIPLFQNIICKIFDIILEFFLTGLVSISTFFANLPMALITTTHPNIMQIILYYIIVLLFVLLLNKFSKKLLNVIFGLIFILLISTINIPNNKTEIIAFSVQNADAFLIKTPHNKYFMIDTAKSGYLGGKSQAEIIILKYLKDKGIKNLEGIIITHFDNDHSGGAIDLYNNLNVKNVYVNSLNDNSKTSQKIYKTINPVILTKNDKIIYQEENFYLKTYITNITKNDNENSIITELKSNDFDMLFMGDAGITAYNKLKTILPKNISVLKLGHHGAKNVIDKNMLNELNPKYVLISNASNDSKHPHILTQNVLRKSNVLRTDINNSIKISTDKNQTNIYTFDKEKYKYLKLY